MSARSWKFPRALAGALCAALVVPVRSLSAEPRTPIVPGEPSTNVAELIAESAARFGLPAPWLAAVMRVESAGRPRAVSPKGAIGLMQLMPRTWSALRLRYGLGPDPFDPRDNILAGAAYLRELYDRYGPDGFLAAYNAGPGRFERALGAVQSLPAETLAYVARVRATIDGRDQENAVGVTPQLVSWRAAALFTSGSSSVPVPSSAPVAPRLPQGRHNPDLRGISSLVPTSAGLFVTAGR